MESSAATPSRRSIDGSFLRRTGAMLAFGVIGLLGLAVTSALQLAIDPSIAERSGLPADASLPVAVAMSLGTPAVFVVLAAIVGTASAPRVGFRSLVHDSVATGSEIWQPFRDVVTRAAAVGLVTGISLVALDALVTTVGPEPPVASGAEQSLALVAAGVPARFLFGGIAEELLLRWGLVSALALILGGVVPGDRNWAVTWSAVVLAAIVFGAAHLPAAAASTELTAALVARIVMLNALAGIVFGWLFVSESLEAAMIAHASAHVPLLAVAIGATL